MTSLPSLMVIVVCGLMWFQMESTTRWMYDTAINECEGVFREQEEEVNEIVNANVSTEAFYSLLQSVGKSVERHVKWPADTAVNAMSGYMRTKHRLSVDGSWTGATAQQRKQLRYRAWQEIPGLCSEREQSRGGDEHGTPMHLLDAVYVIFEAGQLAGVSVSRDQGPCGRCSSIGSDHLTGFDAENFSGEVLAWPGDTAPIEVSQTEAQRTSVEAVLSRATMAQTTVGNATAAPLTKAWSKVYPLGGEEPMKVAWTTPVAHCGDSSCFDGVIAAEISLRLLDEQCLGILDEAINEQAEPKFSGPDKVDGSVFIVNHVSKSFPEQQGLLLSASRATAHGVKAENSDYEFISVASRAILNKFGSWDNASLQQKHQNFSVDWPAAKQGVFKECQTDKDAHRDDCVQIGTLSVALDESTRWLAVVALPASTFTAPVQEETEEQLDRIKEARTESTQALNGQRITLSIVFAVVGIVSVLVGLGLGYIISEPLQNLSGLMQLLGNLQFMRQTDAFRPLRQGRRSRIEDISSLEETFCRSLSAIEDFARFVPEPVVKRIVDGEKRATRLHVDKKEVTIMFCTIEDFAQIVSSAPQFASRCYAVMTHIAEQFKGTVSEILSDGILVIWNTPDNVPYHKAWACAAALSIKSAIEALDRVKPREITVIGTDPAPLRVQIGLNSGDSLAGNIGSDLKMKFGCLGDAVNLASRVHGLCNIFGISIAASKDTVEEVMASGIFSTRRIGKVRVKGRREYTEIHELLGLGSAAGTETATSPRIIFQEDVADSPPHSAQRPVWTPGTGCTRWSSGATPFYLSPSATMRSCIPCVREPPASNPGRSGQPMLEVPSSRLPHTLLGREQRGHSPSPHSCEMPEKDRVADMVTERQSNISKAYEDGILRYENNDLQHALEVFSKLELVDPVSKYMKRHTTDVIEELSRQPQEETQWHGEIVVSKKR